MKNKMILNIIIVSFIIAGSVYAQWSNDPGENTFLSIEGINPKIEADGEGGAIVVWESFYANRDIIAQRVDKDGYLMWKFGAPVCTAPHNQHIFDGEILSDGKGGAYIAWDDRRHSTIPAWWDSTHVYVQHINRDGEPLWEIDGIQPIIITGNTQKPRLVSDGEDGVFIVVGFWKSGQGVHLYVQHLSWKGERLWGDKGVLIDSSSRSVSTFSIVSDDSGGIIVTWTEVTGYAGTLWSPYIQRIDSNGQKLWYERGIKYDTTSNSLTTENLVKDDCGGAISIYRIWRTEPEFWRLFAQRFNSKGEILWGENGIAVSPFEAEIRQIFAVPDGQNGVILTWKDSRTGYMQWDFYSQRIDSSGNLLWDDTQAPAGTHLISDRQGGAILLQSEEVNDSTYRYVQRINGQGLPLWCEKGVIYTTQQNFSGYYDATNDKDSGVIVVFDSFFRIHVQWVDKDGNLGGPTGVEINQPNNLPEDIHLFQNYPNPFNANTTIKYQLATESDVRIKIYNVQGREVKTLINIRQKAGIYHVDWDGKDKWGRDVTSGIYLCQLASTSFKQVRKLTLIK